jgi:transketolase
MELRGFGPETLPDEAAERFTEIARIARGDILKMTTLASSGHPGGSMSSIDTYVVLYSCANVDPSRPRMKERDRIVISHGHTSPGVYAALGRTGFFDSDEAICTFRTVGSRYEGHVERYVPGVEWSTGNLGQGLSAGCGFALAGRLNGLDYQVFVVMGDGEQQKGQITEARRFAKKYGLNNITVVVDLNGLQISGETRCVMPQNIKENFVSDGWHVVEIDGHDHRQIYSALKQAAEMKDCPVAIIARTVMSKGVSFMENDEHYHGVTLKEGQCRAALKELGLEDDLDKYKEMKARIEPRGPDELRPCAVTVDTGEPHTYSPEDKTDNRSAYGRVMKDLAELNSTSKGSTPVAVLDCDLAASVKTGDFAAASQDRFFQGGIQEHNTATIAGALSIEGVLTFFADFGVFGVDETYNQERLNAINGACLKLVCTHNGLDVGEDGKTHQCIDYIGLINNLFGFKIIVPADPNQTDRVVRYIAGEPGPFFIPVGRSKLPVVTDPDGSPMFGNEYEFRYGKADVVRKGNDATIVSSGTMLHRALKASDTLAEKGHKVGVLNISCLTDPDSEAIRAAAETGVIVTYEDHSVRTGLGSIVANVLAEGGLAVKFRKMGVTAYGSSGKPDALFEEQGLGIESLVNTVESLITSE